MQKNYLDKIEKYLSRYFWLVILILSIPAIWALFVKGFFGASDELHIAWLFEMDKTLSLSQFPPRYVPDLSYQFGYPLFNFVFPLPFYLGEIIHKLGFNFVDSVKTVLGLSLVLSVFSMYALLKNLTSRINSLAGALVYLYTPYRSTDVYVRGAIGETLAFVFLPLVALSVIKITEKTSNKLWIGLGGLSLAALVLTHNITTYMFMPFLLLLVLINLLFEFSLIKLVKVASMIILGLLISSFFWVPALLDSSLMRYDTVFNFIDHFPTLIQLTKPSFGYGASVAGPYDGMSFFIGSVNWILVLLASGIIFKNWKSLTTLRKQMAIWVLISFLSTIFMMNYRSVFLWNITPLLPFFQFPWRFLIITTFLSSFMIIFTDHFKYSKQLSLLLLLLAVGLNFSFFRPHDFLGRTDSYFINKYIPNKDISPEYRMVQEEYLRLPKDTVKRPDNLYPKAYAPDNSIKGIYEKNALESVVFIEASQSSQINISKYAFPGWIGILDGNKIDYKIGQPFSQLVFDIPAGSHKLEVMFRETSFKLFLDLISVLFLVVALVFLWPNSTRKMKKQDD